MSDRNNAGLFDPQDLLRLGIAFEAALTIASDHSGPFSDIPGRDLRRRIASAVLKAARQGVHRADELKAWALRDVCVAHALAGA